MYTIKQAARRTGVSEASLRSWERRYGVVAPRRSESGYRLYDDDALAAVSTMRRLVESGWSAKAAAEAVLTGAAPVDPVSDVLAGMAQGLGQVAPAAGGEPIGDPRPAQAITYMVQFLSAAASLDTEGIERSLDGGFALGSFEHVVDSWLFPTLEALGEGWVRGEIDIAGEHAASHAVLRRLSAAFDAAGSSSRGPAVVIGLPPGSQHHLGALAFATAARRRGLDVLYLGADVPVDSWEKAVEGRAARAAVVSVVTSADRRAAAAVAERLLSRSPAPLVCAGGAASPGLPAGVHVLAGSVAMAARELDELAHGTASHAPA